MKRLLLAIGFCTLASSAQAAIAFVQSTGTITGSSAISTSTFFNANVTAGDMIWCATNWGDTTHTMKITDGGSDVFTSSGGFTSNATLGRCQVFYSTNSAGGFKKVTATINAGTVNITLLCHEYSGVITGNTAALVVDAAISSQSITNVTALTSNNLTTTNANDLGVAGGFSSNSVNTKQPGWNQREARNGFMTEDTLFTITLTTAAKFTASSGIAAVGFQTFFPASGSGPVGTTGMNLGLYIEGGKTQIQAGKLTIL